MTPITSLREEAEPSMDDNENTRKAFEDAVFNRRFRASIQRNPNPPKGFGGLDFISTGCPTQAELCKRDASGDYEDDTVSAMWWGWCTGLARGCIPSHPEYRSSGEREPLTHDETAFVLNELHSQGHGHGSSLDDFEPECPSCTAADKLKIALAAGVAACPRCQMHPSVSAEPELLHLAETSELWARQVSEQSDVRKGIRDAGRKLADDLKAAIERELARGVLGNGHQSFCDQTPTKKDTP